jgi:hypothetical protein
MLNKLSKLFTPKAPKLITFEEGTRFSVSFPEDFSKPQQAPVIPLLDQLRAEVKSLTEQIAAIPEHSELDAVNIEHVRDRLRAAQVAVEKAQAQCRAGFIDMQAIQPLQDDAEAVRDTIRTALARKQQREQRIMLVARLNDLRGAVNV